MGADCQVSFEGTRSTGRRVPSNDTNRNRQPGGPEATGRRCRTGEQHDRPKLPPHHVDHFAEAVAALRTEGVAHDDSADPPDRHTSRRGRLVHDERRGRRLGMVPAGADLDPGRHPPHRQLTSGVPVQEEIVTNDSELKTHFESREQRPRLLRPECRVPQLDTQTQPGTVQHRSADGQQHRHHDGPRRADRTAPRRRLRHRPRRATGHDHPRFRP